MGVPLISIFYLCLASIAILITIAVEIRTIYQLFYTFYHISKTLKTLTIVAIITSLIICLLNFFIILNISLIDELDIKNNKFSSSLYLNIPIIVNFVLPLFICLLKISVYVIFIGQLYSLFVGSMYPIAKRTLTLYTILILISVVIIGIALVFDAILIVKNEDENNIILYNDGDIFQIIFKWDFFVLIVDDLFLSAAVLYLFVVKLLKSMRFSRSATFMINDVGVIPGRNMSKLYIDEEDRRPSYICIAFCMKNVFEKHMFCIIIAMKKKEKKGAAVGLSKYYASNTMLIGGDGEIELYSMHNMKESMVHMLIKYLILVFSAFVFTEVLYVSLLNERFTTGINIQSVQFEITRIVQIYCAMFTSLFIYMHFRSSFSVYYCLCNKCHHRLYVKCTNCVANKHSDDGKDNWDEEDEIIQMKSETIYMQL